MCPPPLHPLLVDSSVLLMPTCNATIVLDSCTTPPWWVGPQELINFPSVSVLSLIRNYDLDYIIKRLLFWIFNINRRAVSQMFEIIWEYYCYKVLFFFYFSIERGKKVNACVCADNAIATPDKRVE